MKDCEASASAVLNLFEKRERGRNEINRMIGRNVNPGRGGGVYIDSDSTSLVKPLNFIFTNVSFTSNLARIGRDVFVFCYNLEGQVNETQFKFDLREGSYIRKNGLFGSDLDNDDVDLIELVVMFQSATIYVSSMSAERSSTKQCGPVIVPCSSLSVGLEHLMIEFESKILIEDSVMVEGGYEIEDFNIKTRKESGILLIKSMDISQSVKISQSMSFPLKKIDFFRM
jgi:hypothetical protein